MRGFFLSMTWSIIRFKPNAALRAPNMAINIQPICAHEGRWPFTVTDPKMAPINAKGSANNVCSILIISKKTPIFLNMPILLNPNM
ncbi:hypothetical protein CM49_02370 [Paenibacillus sp. P1XP2]|nr:hypothetical protein CM49_02370 [Paenibacillus sp. P1XP2]